MKFSIITPSFNQGKYIEQTIKSVIEQQGNFDIEYFVMDGGSTDNTVNILQKYSKLLHHNQRIKFFWQSKRDKGQVDALNQALIKTTGDIIAYINSDDYYFPNSLKKILTYFNTHPQKEWLVGNCQVSDKKFNWTFWLKHIWPIQIFKSALLVFNTINQPSVFLRRKLVDKVGLFNSDYQYAFDYDYWLRCQKHSLPGRLYDNLSVFRIQPNSKGNTGYQKQFKEDWQIFNQNTSNIILKILHNFGKILVNTSYKHLK